ncbi:MAG: phosphatidylserine decarboxylase, partial [Betaproteobacteria bacterium]|nr:phosphatidylserine decarboxylase [Betaproteobacteria bacterium]
MSDQLAVLPQYLMPKQAMTQLAGHLANAEWGRFTTWVIKRFVK